MIDLASFKLKVDKAEVDQASDSLKGLGKELPGVGGHVDDLASAFTKLKSPLTAAIALFGAAAAGALKLAGDAIQAADNLKDFSEATGRASEQLQVFQTIADKSGGNMESLIASLDKMAVKMVKFGDDEGKAFSSALDYFGVGLTDVNGKMKTTEQLAQEVAEAYKETEKSASANAAAMEILGKSYLQNINTLSELSNAEAEHEKLSKSGALASKELMEASDEYNDSLTDLSNISKGVGNYVAATFLPVMSGLSTSMFDSATNGGLLNYALDALGKVLEVVAFGLKVVASAFVGLDTGIQLASKSVNLLVNMFDALTSWDANKAKQAWKSYTDEIIKTSIESGKTLDKIWSSIDAKGPGKEKSNGEDRGTWTPPTSGGSKGGKDKVSDIEKEYERQQKAIVSLIESQNRKNEQTEMEISLIGKSAEEQTKLRAEYEKSILTRKLEAQGYDTTTEAAQDYLNKMVELEIQKQKESDKQKHIDNLKKEADSLRDLIDPLFKYTKQLERIDEMEKQGIITSEEKLEMLWKVNEEMDKVSQKSNKMGEDQKTMWDNLEKAIDGYTRNMADAFVEFAITGKSTFGDFVGSVLKDLARMFANEAFKDLLKMGKSAFSDAGGFSGIASGIGGWISGLFASANGNVFNNGQPMAFATGGVLNSPMKFPLAGGTGLAGEAGEEAIMPLRRGPSGRLGVEMTGSGSHTTNNIVNVGDVIVTTKESDQNDGKKMGREIAEQIKSIVIQTLHNERRAGNSLNPVVAGGR